MGSLFANLINKLKSKKEKKLSKVELRRGKGSGTFDEEGYLTQEIFSYDEEKDDDISVSKEIREMSKNGYNLLKSGQIDDAIFCFEKLLEIAPENSYALVGLGDAYRKSNSIDSAMIAYKKVLDAKPENVHAMFGLACCYRQKKQTGKALELFEAYLKKDPFNCVIMLKLADGYRRLRNFRKAKYYYTRILKTEPKNNYAYIGMGYLYYDFKDYDKAISYWGQVINNIDIDKNIKLLTAVGNCYRKMKYYDLGVPYFLDALEIDGNNFYALFGVADCYRGLQQHQKSIVYWQKLLEIEPDNKVILTRIGDSCRNVGELERAEKYYQEALSMAYDSYAVLGLVSILKTHGEIQGAIDLINKYISLDKKNYRFYIEMADCHQKQGNPHKALAVLKEFQKIGGTDRLIDSMIEKIKASM